MVLTLERYRGLILEYEPPTNFFSGNHLPRRIKLLKNDWALLLAKGAFGLSSERIVIAFPFSFSRTKFFGPFTTVEG